jgi:hypothetical protein
MDSGLSTCVIAGEYERVLAAVERLFDGTLS